MFKNKVKIVGIISLMLVLSFGLIACGSDSDDSSEKNKDSFFSLDFGDYFKKAPKYKGVKVEADKIKVSKVEIQAKIDEDLAAAAGKPQTLSKGKVKDGDEANIDYEGKLNGKAFEGGTAKGHNLVIGSHSFIAGFEEGVIGMKVGETKDLNLTFPENYGNKDLAGKAVVFTVKVNSISRSHTGKLDKEFVKNNTKFSTIKAYKKDVKKRIKAEKKKERKERVKASLWSKIEENIKVSKYPKDELAKMERLFKINTESMVEQQGMSMEDFLKQQGLEGDKYEKKIKEVSKKQFDMILFVNYVAQKEDLKVSGKKLEKQKYLIAKSMFMDAKESNSKKDKATLIKKAEKKIKKDKTLSLDFLARNALLVNEALDFVYDNAKIKEIDREKMMEEMMKKSMKESKEKEDK